MPTATSRPIPGANSRTRGTRYPGSELSDVRCSRKGCKKFCTRLALQQSPPYCSRACAFPEQPPKCWVCRVEIPKRAGQRYCGERCNAEAERARLRGEPYADPAAGDREPGDDELLAS